MKGHPSLPVPLPTGHFSAAQTTATSYLDTQCSEPAGRSNTFFHGPPKRDSSDQLKGYILGNQLGVYFGLSDLLDINYRFPLYLLFKVSLDIFDFRTLLANDEARSCRMYLDPYLVCRSFYFDL